MASCSGLRYGEQRPGVTGARRASAPADERVCHGLETDADAFQEGDDAPVVLPRVAHAARGERG